MDSSLQSVVTVNSAIRSVVLSALGQVPFYGWLISPLVGLFWPTGKKALWDQIIADARAQLQQILNQDFDKYTLDKAVATIDGMRNSLQQFVDGTQSKPPLSPNLMQSYYTAATNTMQTSLPQLQLAGFETLLLPLYAQAINMAIALYRNGASPANAALMGFSPADTQLQATELSKLANSAIAYVSAQVPAGYTKVYNNAVAHPPSGPSRDSGRYWNPCNQYNRYMALSVSDYAFMWKYLMDPDFTGSMPPNNREIYSDAIGSLYSYPPGTQKSPTGPLQSASNKPLISGMRLFGNNRTVDGVQQAYAGAWGPRMGLKEGSDSPPNGWNGNIDPKNPIASAGAWRPDYGWVLSIQMKFLDGTLSGKGGTNDGEAWWAFDQELVSQVYVETYAQGPNSKPAANAVIFGFRYADSYPAAT